MALKIEETFQVEAPAERVWQFLVDPHRVVECLPGAELLEAVDANTFVGRVKVKVGPVTASYQGRASFVERDDENRRVRMVGEGKETGGPGSAKLTMSSRVVARGDGTSEVHVEAEMDVVGRIVQFGRGMIEEVNRQLFRQFADCARARLVVEGAAVTTPESAAVASAETAAPGGVLAPEAEPAPAAPNLPPAASAPPAEPRGAEPVRAIPLLVRALWSMFSRSIGRLFRRG